MVELKDREREIKGKETVLSAGETKVVVLPQEGALVSRFTLGERDILFPDQEFVIGKEKKRRGGMPILFPQAGPLTEEQDQFRLPPHGFARDLSWEKIVSDKTKAVLSLGPSDETRPNYPYQFGLGLQVTAEQGGLDYELSVSNNGEEVMPIAPGFHPYFSIPAESMRSLKTNIPRFDITKYELGRPLFFPMQEEVEISIPGVGQITMIPGESFVRPEGRLVVWSDSEKYLCVEPWSAGLNGLLHPKERVELKQGEIAKFSLQIRAELE